MALPVHADAGQREEMLRQTRCSIPEPSGIVQIEVALNGFPQVVLGITAEAAMLATPIVIPVGGVHGATSSCCWIRAESCAIYQPHAVLKR
jgi:hypothetical protein